MKGKRSWGKCPATVGTPEAESRGLARASAPSRRRLGARWRAQSSSAITHRSGSADLHSKTARERRRRHQRTSPARHRCEDPVRFTASAQSLNHFPAPEPDPTPGPGPPSTRRANGTVLRVFRDIPELERRSGGCLLALLLTRSFRHRTRVFTKLAGATAIGSHPVSWSPAHAGTRPA
jgi:hypothetical protein